MRPSGTHLAEVLEAQPCFSECLYSTPSHDRIKVCSMDMYGYTMFSLLTGLLWTLESLSALEYENIAENSHASYNVDMSFKHNVDMSFKLCFRGRLLGHNTAMFCLPNRTHSFLPLAPKCPLPRSILTTQDPSGCYC